MTDHSGRKRLASFCVLYGVSAGMLVTTYACARAQTAGQSAGQPSTGVIQPPAKIDPKMTVEPPNDVKLPTPVVHQPAPAPKGTIVVPK